MHLSAVITTIVIDIKYSQVKYSQTNIFDYFFSKLKIFCFIFKHTWRLCGYKDGSGLAAVACFHLFSLVNHFERCYPYPMPYCNYHHQAGSGSSARKNGGAAIAKKKKQI
ncbi:MAG: hypothetical protein DRH32_07500 [Deltaproteobacteria bacterium]|nr:MAG: hypothetical protein DRH32_07500 [Deltaproteobacteria bacterium]